MRFAKSSSRTRISSGASYSASSFEGGLEGVKARKSKRATEPLGRPAGVAISAPILACWVPAPRGTGARRDYRRAAHDSLQMPVKYEDGVCQSHRQIQAWVKTLASGS